MIDDFLFNLVKKLDFNKNSIVDFTAGLWLIAFMLVLYLIIGLSSPIWIIPYFIYKIIYIKIKGEKNG